MKYINLAIFMILLVSLYGCGRLGGALDSNAQDLYKSEIEEPNVTGNSDDKKEIEEQKDITETKDTDVSEKKDHQKEIVMLLDENTEYLNKYIKASSNKNIGMFGLEEEFEGIKEKSEQTQEITLSCIAFLENESKEDKLEKFYTDILLVNEQLKAENDKMKEAKRTLDVESLEYTVNELAGILDNYVVILDQFYGGD
jgi:hypothetical protein